MASISTTEAPPTHQAVAARPYAPSWVDYFTDMVGRLPVPAWLFYLALAAGSVLFFAALGSFTPISVLTALTPVYILALIHYLDNSAAAALARFRPALNADDAEYERLRYQFTTLPARPALVANLILGLPALILPLTYNAAQLQQGGYPTSPIGFVFGVAYSVLGLALAALFAYHTIRQLRMVNRIYTTQAHIDLFQRSPLYALSELTARTAIGFGLLQFAWAVGTSTLTVAAEGALFITVFFLAISGLAFIVPLLGAHRLLQQEKERLKDEASQRLKAMLDETHRRADAGDFVAVASMNNALDTMVKEQGVLDKISTWPWQVETVRGLVAALVLPTIIWFITRVLGQFIH